ncbi:hypothetical protein PV327_005852 [Microctonus hyperodae]|uniref:Uncharacterized protein n=1 Tax=Microctonus hyperodae TaxID=165561 RepID=A0AA39G2J6_MICHY|nr:hypothetical protein PV327_005852 [Microctonus hyperodae]
MKNQTKEEKVTGRRRNRETYESRGFGSIDFTPQFHPSGLFILFYKILKQILQPTFFTLRTVAKTGGLWNLYFLIISVGFEQTRQPLQLLTTAHCGGDPTAVIHLLSRNAQ